MDVMLVGAMRGVFLAIDKMGRSKGGNGGRIINVASAAGLTVMIVHGNVFSYTCNMSLSTCHVYH